jgi:pyridoxamine 5'-phosphate oxidase
VTYAIAGGRRTGSRERIGFVTRQSLARLAAMREVYARGGLTEADLAGTWLTQFERWLADAIEAGMPEANAMVLGTASAAGRPSSRTVLLKGLDERGFVFYTHHGSAKGRDIAENPQVSLLFPWHPMQRQVRVEGVAAPITDAEADAYFASRPHGSQIGALASPQSEVIPSRAALQAAVAEAEARYPDGHPVPRPEGWGGYRVAPDLVEFWQGRPDRLHDRLRYRRDDGGWITERLAP